jgi:hypothetical protein
MQIAARQPVSVCLETSVKTSTQSVSRRWVLDRRTSGCGVVPTTDMAAVLFRPKIRTDQS